MWLLLPIKAFHLAKQRLSGLLSVSERSRLAQAMATDVLNVVKQHAGFEHVVVCSGDPAVESMARLHGAAFLDETSFGCDGLDQVVNRAADRMFAEGAGGLAVIHCDLPLLTCEELDRFLAVHGGGDAPAVTITPDRWRGGTNLLAWRPHAEFSAQYGTNSFRRHCELARRCGASVQVCELPGAGLDIDEPDDLRAFALDPRLDLAPATRRYLSDSGLAERISSLSPCMTEVS